MNRKHLLFALFFAGFMFCLLGIFMCGFEPQIDSTRKTAWQIGAGLCVVAMAAVWFRPSKLPDLLAEAGLKYFERQGFCFAVTPFVEHGQARLAVCYQNRYDTPCTAEILLKPDDDTGLANVRRQRLSIACGGAGAGMESVPWPMPVDLAGRKVTFLVGADVTYPQARGKMLRFKDGIAVGSIRQAKDYHWAMLWDQPAQLELIVPPGLIGTRSPLRLGGSTPSSSHPDQPATADIPTTPAGPPRATSPTTSTNSDALPSHQEVAGIVVAVNDDAARNGQEAAVKRLKRTGFWSSVGVMMAMSLLAALFLLYGILGFVKGWSVPGTIPAILFGAVFCGYGFWGLAGLLPQLFLPYPTSPGTTILETCQVFYKRALESFNDSDFDFTMVCECLPGPVLQAYRSKPPRARRLLRAWRKLRETFIAEDADCTVEEVVVAEKPRSDARVVDLIVGLRGPRFGRLAFKNIAVRGNGRWYLATPEPIVVASEEAEEG